MKLALFLFLVHYSLTSLFATPDSELSARLRQHVSILASDSLQGRGLGTPGAEKARHYIAGQFREAGILPFPGTDDYLQHFRFRQSLAWINAWNIVGYMEGSDPELKNEYIVIGAHYDHLGFEETQGGVKLFPGADDNASGVAAIIEIGRHFALNPDLLKRSLIIVAFDAEESGLKGSEHFVESNLVPVSSMRLMLSFDMVGMLEANKGVLLRGIASMQGGGELATAVAANHDITIKGTGARIENRTDTAPFGRRGIPAAHVYTDTKSPYHKPEDQYHLLDYKGMAAIVTYSADLISQASAFPRIYASEQFDVKPDLLSGDTSRGRFSYGFSLHNGPGYHQYKEQFYQANSAVSVAGGLYARVSLGRRNMVSLQQEVLYDINRSKIEAGNFNRHSVTLPFNIQIGTPSLNVPFRAYSFAGPYFRYSFSGKSGGVKIDYSVYEQQEWGYSAGFAIDILRVSLGFTYRNALTNLQKDEELIMLQTNRYFTLLYRF